MTDIIELKIGYDGIVIATARTGNSFNFELNDLYEGLAKEVPGAGGAFVANPTTTWNQVNAGLPNQRIQVYGPPPTSGTRDAFLELGMTPGAKLVPAAAAVEAQDDDRFEALAHTLREDGVWIDSGENDNAIVQTLTRTPGSLGVFGYLLPGTEPGHGEGRDHRRHRPDARHHRRRLLSAGPQPLHLCEEGRTSASRRACRNSSPSSCPTPPPVAAAICRTAASCPCRPRNWLSNGPRSRPGR